MPCRLSGWGVIPGGGGNLIVYEVTTVKLLKSYGVGIWLRILKYVIKLSVAMNTSVCEISLTCLRTIPLTTVIEIATQPLESTMLSS